MKLLSVFVGYLDTGHYTLTLYCDTKKESCNVTFKKKIIISQSTIKPFTLSFSVLVTAT